MIRPRRLRTLLVRPGPARTRGLAAAGVVAYLALTTWWLPAREQRADAHYVLVLTLGYGHLIGSASFAARRACARPAAGGRARRAGRAVLGLAGIGLALELYLRALERAPLVVAVPLLALATWHSVENDLMLGALYRSGHRPPALSRGLARRSAEIGLSVLLLALAAAGLRRNDLGGVSWPPFGDVFAASTLYHLLSWLIISLERCAAAPAAAARSGAWQLLIVHALPASIGLALLLPSGEIPAALRRVVYSPAVYLFWSSLHVLQTLRARGRRGFDHRSGRRV